VGVLLQLLDHFLQLVEAEVVAPPEAIGPRQRLAIVTVLPHSFVVLRDVLYAVAACHHPDTLEQMEERVNVSSGVKENSFARLSIHRDYGLWTN
jgi:hypothetical protein